MLPKPVSRRVAVDSGVSRSSWWLKMGNSAGRSICAPGAACCSSTPTRPPGRPGGLSKGTPRPRGRTRSTARSPARRRAERGAASCGSRRPRASGSGTAERRSPMAPRWHCCIWAEGITDEYQSGGCSRGEGPRKGLKMPIVDVIWGVQASKWRTPRVLIARCNSALDVPSGGVGPDLRRLVRLRQRIRLRFKR
jgi:hypothetical protein